MHEDRHPIGDRGTTPAQVSQLYRLLADQRRRTVIQHLRDTETFLPVSAFEPPLTRHEDRKPSDEITDAEIALHHIHLPKLADAGIIEYDQSTQQATYTAPPQVDALLDQMLVTVSPGEQNPSPED